MEQAWLTLLDGLCATCLSIQQAQCPEAFAGRGVVVPESQVELALSGQMPVTPQPGFREETDRLEDLSQASDTPLARLLRRTGAAGPSALALVLAWAPTNNRKYERIFAYLQDDVAQRAATVGLLADLWALVEPVEDAALYALLDPAGPLCRFVLDEGKGDGLSRTLTLRSTAWRYLAGADQLPRPLDGFCRRRLPEEAAPPSVHRELVRRCGGFLQWRLEEPAGQGVLALCGQEGAGRRTILRQAAGQLGQTLLEIDCLRLWAMEPEEREQAVRTAASHCYLTGDVPVLYRFDAGLSTPGERERLPLWLLDRFRDAAAVTAICGEKTPMLSQVESGRMLCMEVPNCTLGKQRQLWAELAARRSRPLDPGVDPRELAGVYALTPGQMDQALAVAESEAAARGAEQMSREDIARGVRLLCAPYLAEVTQPLVGTFTWDDLILEEPQLLLLRQVCDRFRYRWKVNEEWGFDRKLPYGKGVSVLLYGPPGTGKTMAAQVLAREFGLDAYRVDLSRIMDKYIGETEKKLAALFDAARGANAILFFDEADALFAKRTEVQDSKDRYANAETAYLLQRMEAHNGICILASNAAQNFDEAFKRRISYLVNLPMPSVETRRLLWGKVFPAETPLRGVDLDDLAQRFELTGSSIKSVAVSAAFRAAAEDSPVTRAHLLQAVREEFLKTGRVVMEHEIF